MPRPRLLTLLSLLAFTACTHTADVPCEDCNTEDASSKDTETEADTIDIEDATNNTEEDTTTSTDATVDTTEDITPPLTFAFETPGHAALPFVAVGEAAPQAELRVTETGGGQSPGAGVVELSGPFEVVNVGTELTLESFETTTLTLRYTGDMAVAANVEGAITVRFGDDARTTSLAAVVGVADLPEGVTWSDSDAGIGATVAMPSAPFPSAGSSWDDPSVHIFIPRGFLAEDGLHTVTHIHGHTTLLPRVLERHALREQLAASGRQAILIAPQGPEQAASGDLGKLDNPDGFAHLVRDTLALLYRDGQIDRAVPGEAVLTAHSGGYLGVANILDVGGMPITAVHLLDALYARAETYRAFAQSGGVLRSTFTDFGGTVTDNAALLSALRADGLTVSESTTDDALHSSTLTIARNPASHNDCVIEQRAIARMLTASTLPRRRGAAPEILAIRPDTTDTVEVVWRTDHAAFPVTYIIEGSDDGTLYTRLATSPPDASSVSVPVRPFLRVRALSPEGDAESAPSDVYGAGAAQANWLVVDGFDRILGGSYTALTHDFAARVGAASGLAFHTASNEAVASGLVSLDDYAGVIWLLGDESTLDVTFDDRERAALSAFLDGGGKLLVSGSELGYATDPAFLNATLHTTYVADNAGTTTAATYTFGVVYPEDFPDVLSGSTTIWTYATGGAAAVAHNNQLVTVGFPLETLPDDTLDDALSELLGWL